MREAKAGGPSGPKPQIFISYKRGGGDETLAVEIEAALTTAGFHVLRDVSIEPGERWSDELWLWLMECSGAVVIVSEAAAESDWCRREWAVLAARQAHSRLRVVPVQTDGHLPDVLRHLQMMKLGPAKATAARVAKRLGDVAALTVTPQDYLAAHAGWLDWQYRQAPALGREPFALADVYQATECGVMSWGELSVDSTLDPFSEDVGGRGDLVDTVLRSFGDPTLDEPVVVQGPAGSGKSAFCLHLANRLVAEGLTPVLIRVRDLRLATYDNVDELLQDAVRVAPKGERPPPPSGPLFGPAQLAETTTFGGATISRIVLILDGWDEVALTGSTRFRSRVEELLTRVRERFSDHQGQTIRVLLTGRPSVDIHRSGLLRRQTPILTVRHLRPDQLRAYAAAISARLTSADWSLDLARCEDAFARYEAWFGGRGQQGTDVLGSPLLALLAFRTVAEWPGDTAGLFGQPTALYNALIEVTSAHAGKAEEGPEGTVHRGGRSLRRLLQRVASIITSGGTESVSYAELASRLEDDDALLAWSDQATSESSLHELVVNFYFKGHHELGCEFLHKSFREYLYAEAIVAELDRLSERHRGSHAPPEREWNEDWRPGTPQHAASRSLGLLLAPQLLTNEVRDHAFWLIERGVDADPQRWVWLRDLLADVYDWWANRGHLRIFPERRRGREKLDPPLAVDWLQDLLPHDGPFPPSSMSITSLDVNLGRALLQFTAFVHGRLLGETSIALRACQSDRSGQLRFAPLGEDSGQVIARIGFMKGKPFTLEGLYLGPVDLENGKLAGVDLEQTDLRGGYLRGCILAQAHLGGVNLAGADLRQANLQRAMLSGAILSGATFRGAVLSHAYLEADAGAHADFDDARLDGTSLEHQPD